MTPARPLLLLACVVAWLGCAGSGPPPEATPIPGNTPLGGIRFDLIQRDIFNPSCLPAGCHNAQSQAGNLNLTEGSSYADLIDVRADNAAARRAGLRRVAPFRPEESFLFIKITQPAAGQGSRMPLVGASLSPAQIELVRSWIAAGARPGEGAPRPVASPTPLSTASHTSSPEVSPTLDPPTPTPAASGTSTASPAGTLPPDPSATRTPTVAPAPTATATATFNPDATLENIQSTIFTPSCLFAGCHNSADQQNDLTLEAGQSFAELVGAVPFNTAARNRGLRRVDPGHPENSFLLVKLTLPGFDPGFFSPMPLARDPLTAEQIRLIRDWILRGAPE